MTKGQDNVSATGIATVLLSRAHSPTTSSRLYAEQVKQKPLVLSAGIGSAKDARESRRRLRRTRDERLNVSRKTKAKKATQPLSAKQKRALGVYDVCKEEMKWTIYLGLEKMWCAYMREVLGLEKRDEKLSDMSSVARASKFGPLLTSADFHGARIRVVRSKCASYVGLEGIVVREGKFSFVIITQDDDIKIIPKRQSVFVLSIWATDSGSATAEPSTDHRTLLKSEGERFDFELYGSQFENRAAERAHKRFKLHVHKDI